MLYALIFELFLLMEACPSLALMFMVQGSVLMLFKWTMPLGYLYTAWLVSLYCFEYGWINAGASHCTMCLLIVYQ